MRKIVLAIACLFFASLFSCNHGKQSHNNTENNSAADTLNCATESPDAYRDTLIGKFDGVHVDTLIAEPIGTLEDQDYPFEGCEGWYWNWRVFTTGGTVQELILNKCTVGIQFVEEGDLNGDGTDEWGYVTEWPTSTWMRYNTFTFFDGSWVEFIPAFSVWLPHIEIEDTVSGGFYYNGSDLVSKGTSDKTVRIKFSVARNDGADNLQIDNIVSDPSHVPIKSTENL
ncbi:MAG: hypothetical protein K2K52_06130 [Paramuribaculum sp.]|nr:hypothetical protein [Paramuribaculum sp.]